MITENDKREDKFRPMSAIDFNNCEAFAFNIYYV